MDEGETLSPESHPFRFFWPDYRLDPAKEIVLGSLRHGEDRVILKLSLFSPSEDQQALPGFGIKAMDSIGSEVALGVEHNGRHDSINLTQDMRHWKRGFLLPLGKKRPVPIDVQFVPTRPTSFWEQSNLWDQVNLRPKMRESVFSALRLIDPTVQEVVMVGQRHRMNPIVIYRDNEKRVPLVSLGDGMTHLFHIVLALVNAAGGILLVDEFENGLHYAVQPLVWKMIFKLAVELDVQVFATTHSWDCIEAFQQVAGEGSLNDEVCLIRLGRSRRKSNAGEITARTYGYEDLSLATKSQMDLR